MAHTKTRTESDKVQKINPSVQGGNGDRNNARNNTRKSVSITNNNYKVEIEAFGAVLTLSN